MEKILSTQVPVLFPLPRDGERDPHFSLPRSFWINAAVPGKRRPAPPVKSVLLGSNGPGRGRRLIDYESARAHVAKIMADQVKGGDHE